MTNATYQNFVLTVIAIVLIAICAKLYTAPQPAPAAPTLAEWNAVSKIKSREERNRERDALAARLPVAWSAGGDVEVSNTVPVKVLDTVQVETAADAERRRQRLSDFFSQPIQSR